jgi:hypothetical protein
VHCPARQFHRLFLPKAGRKKAAVAGQHANGRVPKGLCHTSSHKQPLIGSEAGLFGLLLDFDADQQLSGDDGQKEARFSDVSTMYD